MKTHLNILNTVAEYQEYSASTAYSKPNVTYVKENKVLYYDYGDNKPKPSYKDFKISSNSLKSEGGNTYGLDETLYINYVPSGVTNPKFSSIKTINISNLPSTVISLDTSFKNSTIERVEGVIPNSVTSMFATFLGCKSLTKAPEIPSGVAHLNETFENCTSLVTAPVILSKANNINITMLYFGCTKLVNVPNLPSGATSMFETFYQCSSLEEVPPIPSGVTDLMWAFGYCKKLKTVTLLATIPLSCFEPLVGCDALESIYVPDASVDAYKTATGWSEFASKIKPLSQKPTE